MQYSLNFDLIPYPIIYSKISKSKLYIFNFNFQWWIVLWSSANCSKSFCSKVQTIFWSDSAVKPITRYPCWPKRFKTSTGFITILYFSLDTYEKRRKRKSQGLLPKTFLKVMIIDCIQTTLAVFSKREHVLTHGQSCAVLILPESWFPLFTIILKAP